MNIAFDGRIQLTLTTKLRWTRKISPTESTGSTDGRRKASRGNNLSLWHVWRKRLWPPTRWFRRRYRSTPSLSQDNRTSLGSSGLENSRSKIGRTSIVIKLEVNRLNGTVLFNIPPTPSDRVWISFLDMPEIEFSVVPFVSLRHAHRIAFLSGYTTSRRVSCLLP